MYVGMNRGVYTTYVCIQIHKIVCAEEAVVAPCEDEMYESAFS